MINEINMCLVSWLKSQTEKAALVQQLNCFHTQGSGIARRIRDEWSIVFDADVKHSKSGDRSKLGDFSVAEVMQDKFAFGLYSQYNYGGKVRNTDYNAMYDGLVKLERHLRENNIHLLGIPRRMGCALGGGSWNVVNAIIDDVFLYQVDSPVEVWICD